MIQTTGLLPASVVAPDMETLVLCCAQGTLQHIDGSVNELGQAITLLGDAMASLRRDFAAALAVDTDAGDAGEWRRHLETAVVGLQCEDALIQMLDSVRQRTLQTADVLRYVVTPRNIEPDLAGTTHNGRKPFEAMASRLRLAAIALEAGIARAGPVRQQRATAGTVDLF